MLVHEKVVNEKEKKEKNTICKGLVADVDFMLVHEGGVNRKNI